MLTAEDYVNGIAYAWIEHNCAGHKTPPRRIHVSNNRRRDMIAYIKRHTLVSMGKRSRWNGANLCYGGVPVRAHQAIHDDWVELDDQLYAVYRDRAETLPMRKANLRAKEYNINIEIDRGFERGYRGKP